MVDLAAPMPAAEQELAEEHGPLIDVGGLAERLGVDVRFVRRLVDERRITFYKVGKHVRFDPATLLVGSPTAESPHPEHADSFRTTTHVEWSTATAVGVALSDRRSVQYSGDRRS